MVTRRGVLKAAAAGSIAAIASAHGVAAAPASPQSGLNAGFGDLQGGALGAFYKENIGFDVFFKFDKFAAEVFYKEDVVGGVDVFYKFMKVGSGWTPFDKVNVLDVAGLQGAEAGFFKLQPDSAGFFLKFVDGTPAQYLTVGADGTLGSEGPSCNPIT